MWKGIALTLIAFLLLVLVFNLFNKPAGVNDPNSEPSPQIKAYYQYLEKQKVKNSKYMQEAFEVTKTAREINEKSFKNQERFEKLLDRWEKQADKVDQIIEAAKKSQN